jgi:hypothetical protein
MIGPARIAQPASALVRPARTWLEGLARWGFVSNAIVYLIVGGLILRWAMGNGGQITGSDGALLTLRKQAGGTLMLMALIPGFFSYALWRVLAAIFDGDRDGSTAAGLAGRAFGLLKGGAYAALGFDTLRLVAATPSSSDGWTRAVFSSPAGPVLMVVIGGALCAFALFEGYRAVTAKLSQGLELHGLRARTRHWVIGISRFGIGARAVVIAAFGILILRGAAHGSAKIPGATESIRTAAQSYVPVYYLIGAGLVAYGVYLIVLARYRRVRTA